VSCLSYSNFASAGFGLYVLLQFNRVSVKSVPFCVAFVRRVSEPAVPLMSEDA
jgi:hypothetical protein